ncbi:DNA-binding MarR family transcriptional regulator [Rhizobium anhuiense]
MLNYFLVMGKKLSIDDAAEALRTGRLSPPELLSELVCTNTSLRRASRRLGQLYDDAVAPTGLKATQVGLLTQIAALREGGHPWPTLQSLAERLAVSISALTHALRPLVRDGLVELVPDEHDGRTKHAMLTRSGEHRMHEALVHWADANQRVEVVLGPSAAALRALADDVASPEFLEAYEARRSLKE